MPTPAIRASVNLTVKAQVRFNTRVRVRVTSMWLVWVTLEAPFRVLKPKPSL